ncbi:MAG: SURF1 family protein [Aeromicrobium sp.]|uniref:SURF1 family cytochrome oxidase biogenesis protein n=1 Tax=Aeromicrobium sp. TaxID=1871063 RepID=UPI0039E30800
MRELRFLASPRWLGFAVFVLALSTVCVQLGFWQFHKLDDRRERNALVREHLAEEPVPLDTVVAAGKAVRAEQEWTVVRATGAFDVDRQVTVKYLSRDGRPGVDVLTPLVLDDGSALIVDRGFFETERTNEQPDDIPEPPTGQVEVTGWLRVNSGATGDAVEVHGGQVRAISSDGLADDLPYPLRDGYLNLQDPVPDPDVIEPEPTPDLGQGPHFFYGLQWWFFAALAVIGYGWFARVERNERRTAYAKATRSA